MLDLITTADGSHSLFSQKFGFSYHSKYGAVQESQHVFIDAGLHHAWKMLTNILDTSAALRVVEFGFGTGLNALMTLLAAEKMGRNVHYTALEAYPISLDEARSLNYVALFDAEKHRLSFEQMHMCASSESIEMGSNFCFEKRLTTFEDLEDIENWDLVYFHPFTPQAQPELWETEILKKVWTAMKPDSFFTTFCAQGQFKRNLKTANFQVETLAGPQGKREMTRAFKKKI